MFRNIRFNVSYLLSLLLLALCIWAIANELRAYNYQDILHSLASIPKRRLSWAIGLTILGYSVMAGYDILGFYYVDRTLLWNKIALTNFISSAFSNTIGFALLTGSAIRYRFYTGWGVPGVAIAQIIAFVNFTFWLGMLTLAGVIFLTNPLSIPTQIHLPFSTVRPFSFIFIFLLVIYLLGSIFIRQTLTIRGHIFRFPNFSISLAQIAISSLDWVLAAAVLYVLLPINSSLSYADFLGVYLLAMVAAIISNIPGGLGVFETIILLLLSSKISAAKILGSLLAYRGIYYFMPVFLAGGLLSIFELRYRKKI
ncbi:Lysylphosphatidylglycerol synthetase/glycosyltransferase AglD [Nostoc flagelliforme CCNUN1]|uniref:Lysylphosphatidylglycerol synthetase/glycosyltransferase AglD n=1 Tax=Nostoc flagelliforme CCNUN1 TaxID=2038116 RepID=A0A2K8SJK5_9NOSO|nr:lysylphosphatidylglycerol synthase domain-containing protein [Nostoc flagelliforme]AUB35588.1 Lysylphosphatidylglycerol synthetase/glycosyltransferase AglD [Nostoc flagelliforme CCNUN1]